jgi:hypothetical protein
MSEQEQVFKGLIKYKAFRTARLDNRRDLYDYVDLWEMHARRYPLHRKNYDWYREHIRQKPLMTVGDNKRVLQLVDPQYYSESGTNYIVVIEKLIARRFFSVSRYELEEWTSEAQRQQQEGEVIFIERPISGIAPCREILQSTAEEPYLHPVVADSNPESQGKTEYDRHNYTIEHKPVEDCGHPDCGVCFVPIEILKEPELLTLGKPRYDEEVREATKKYRKKRRQLRFMRMAMQEMMLSEMTLQESEEAEEKEV